MPVQAISRTTQVVSLTIPGAPPTQTTPSPLLVTELQVDLSTLSLRTPGVQDGETKATSRSPKLPVPVSVASTQEPVVPPPTDLIYSILNL